MATESKGPRISVIIPARNAESTLPACLRAIADSPLQPFETILVSDASSDGTDDVAAAAGVRVVRNERRQGAAYARNVGARADGDAEVGLRERRRVVDAVAHHRDDVSVFLEADDLGDLVLGKDLRDHVIDPDP